MINWEDFEKVEMRIGTIVKAEEFPEARRPAYKVVVDFGEEIGTRKSSAQITHYYTVNELIGKQIIAVVNFPPKQIGPFISECLVMGAYDSDGQVILLQPERSSPNGARIG